MTVKVSVDNKNVFIEQLGDGKVFNEQGVELIPATEVAERIVYKFQNFLKQEFSGEKLSVASHIQNIELSMVNGRKEYDVEQIENMLHNDNCKLYNHIRIEGEVIKLHGRPSDITTKHVIEIDQFLQDHQPLTSDDLKKLEDLMPVTMKTLQRFIYNIIHGKFDGLLGRKSQYKAKLDDPFTVTQKKAKREYKITGMRDNGKLICHKLDLNIKQVLKVKRHIVDKIDRPNGITNRQVRSVANKNLLSKNGTPWDMEKIQRVVYNIQTGTFDPYFKQWEELHQEKLC